MCSGPELDACTHHSSLLHSAPLAKLEGDGASIQPVVASAAAVVSFVRRALWARESCPHFSLFTVEASGGCCEDVRGHQKMDQDGSESKPTL